MDDKELKDIEKAVKHDAYKKLQWKKKRNVILNIVSVLLAIGGIAWACNFFWRYYKYVITNDATIEQYIIPLNSRVGGYITEVRFGEHQRVEAGDTLLVLDNREFEIKVMEAQAALIEAQQTKYNAPTRQREKSVDANILRCQANLEMANLNLSYTVVTAPYAGFLGRRTLDRGQYIQSGQIVTNLIKDDNKWIVANYLEKQIGEISIGQEIRIRVDAIPDKIFEGRVTAISEATGSKYSLLPVDNSAGNFVKIQQRIPVRIDFENVSPEDMSKFRVGMMVVSEAIKK